VRFSSYGRLFGIANIRFQQHLTLDPQTLQQRTSKLSFWTKSCSREPLLMATG
jgi:hypothetical protein